MVIPGHGQSGGNGSHPTSMVPAEVGQGDALLFQLRLKQRCPLWDLCVSHFAFLCFLLIVLLKIAPQNSAKVPSSVPKHEKAEMGPMEKTCALDELPSGVSYSTAGHEFMFLTNQQYVLNRGL